MFTLKIVDRKGIELNIGDIVKVSNGKNFNFYAEIKYLENEKILTPFHTFSFSSFEKADNIPDNAIKSNEERYNIWFVPNSIQEIDEQAKEFSEYLMSWRQCEHLIDTCFKIEPNK
jgi:hypothetical protein